jgi:hypothetical protein
MALDLEAIRKKVAQLNGTLNRSRVKYWKPDLGEYNIRVLPWPNNDGQPFKERWFYYNIGKNPGLLAPTQFQKADPVQELIDKLHASGKKEDKEIAKKLYPKMRAFAPVIVRGADDQVLVWSFGKEIYQRLLEFFLDAEIGDITDVNNGFDLKVKITKAPGKFWPDTTVDVARKSSKLFSDSKKIEDTLSAIPNLDEYHKLKSYDELKSIIEAWSRGDDQDPNQSEGTSRGSEEPDELEKLTSEVAAMKSKTEEKVEETKPAAETKAKGKSKKSDDLEDVLPSSKTADLDSVFDEIANS